MDVNGDKFDPSRPLPDQLRIVQSGVHLYQFGPSLFAVSRVKRSLFRHPALIFTVSLYYIVRSVCVIVLPERDEHFYRQVGDFGYVFGDKNNYNIVVIFTILLSFLSQLYNFYAYLRSIRPTFMRLFDMLSGMRSPQSLGLRDGQVVRELLRRARITFLIGNNVPNSLSSTIFSLNFFLFLQNSTLYQMVVYVIPQSVGWGVIVNMIYNIIFWQLIYFYLITFYLKCKLREVNLYLLSRRHRKWPISFVKVYTDLTAIYGEISEYNSTYWCHYILYVWTTCAIILSTLSFFIIFGKMSFVLRLLCLYFDVFFVLVLLLVIRICSTVYLEANKSYKLLSGLVSNLKHRNCTSCTSIKIMLLMERIGKKKIGFTCWKLFIINSFRGYEIIAFCILLFMKVIEQ